MHIPLVAAVRMHNRQTLTATTMSLARFGVRHATTLTPAVARLVTEHHLVDQLNKIPATGPKHRLLKGDVLAYLGLITPREPPVPTGVQGPPPRKLGIPPTKKADGIQLVTDRLAKAKRDGLLQYQRMVTIDQANQLVKQLNRKQGTSLSLDDLILRAASLAVKHTTGTSNASIEVATPNTSASLLIHPQVKVEGIEKADKLQKASTLSTTTSSTFDKLPAKKTNDSTATVAATQPRSNLLDYLLDTTGQVATPSIRQEFPHQEQRVTLTVVASSKNDAPTAQQLLERIANYLEQPKQML
ncbi:hypothetical protein BDF22DRAFT_699330 [Syncephalis plumigaleata]|nr:hypothetical protein BDF22DRAFT_699330 [Syncephalis plumigaleata]